MLREKESQRQRDRFWESWRWTQRSWKRQGQRVSEERPSQERDVRGGPAWSSDSCEMTGTEKVCGTRPPVPRRTRPPQRSRPGLHSQPGSVQTPELAQMSFPQPLEPLTPNIPTPNIQSQICRSSALNSSSKSRPPSPPNPTSHADLRPKYPHP